MRKGPKIIQINGFRGIIMSVFIVTCLIAGFVIFPAKVAESLWNYVATTYISIPQINILQGVLLWAMVALSIYLINNKHFAISFSQPAELSEDEMKFLMERIKMQQQAQKLNAMILKSNDIKIIKKDIEPEQQEKEVSENNDKEQQL